MSTAETWLEASAFLYEVCDIVLQHTFATTEFAIDCFKAGVYIMYQTSRIAGLVGFRSLSHEILHHRISKSLVENHPTEALQVVLYHIMKIMCFG